MSVKYTEKDQLSKPFGNPILAVSASSSISKKILKLFRSICTICTEYYTNVDILKKEAITSILHMYTLHNRVFILEVAITIYWKNICLLQATFCIFVLFLGLPDVKTCWGLPVSSLKRKFEKTTPRYVLWQL